MPKVRASKKPAAPARTREHERARLDGARIQRELAAVRRVNQLSRTLAAGIASANHRRRQLTSILASQDDALVMRRVEAAALDDRIRDLEAMNQQLAGDLETTRAALANEREQKARLQMDLQSEPVSTTGRSGR